MSINAWCMNVNPFIRAEVDKFCEEIGIENLGFGIWHGKFGIKVKTPHGIEIAESGDYIIKDDKGYYVVTAERYEKEFKQV